MKDYTVSVGMVTVTENLSVVHYPFTEIADRKLLVNI